MTPETAGPMAGATDMTIEMRPMIRPRSLIGTSVSTVVMSSGIMIAVPLAWTTRPTTSCEDRAARGGDQRADREQGHRDDEHRAGVEALQQESGDRDHDGHREREGGRQPLALTRRRCRGRP